MNDDIQQRNMENAAKLCDIAYLRHAFAAAEFMKLMENQEKEIARLRQENEQLRISDTPELYRDLREAVVEMCSNCPSGEENGGETCKSADGACFVQRWRKTLKKARGEE